MGASAPRSEGEHRRLVVTSSAPGKLHAWLSGRANDVVDVLSHPGSAGTHTVDVAAVPLRQVRTGGWCIVQLPLDGPDAAVRVALRALSDWVASPHTAVAPVPMDPVPPDCALLVELQAAGLTPAVDLARVTWVDAEAALVVGHRRLVRIPWPFHDGDRALADLLLGLGTLTDGAPSTRWIQDVADRTTRPDPQVWPLVLSAAYVEACAHRLACV